MCLTSRANWSPRPSHHTRYLQKTNPQVLAERRERGMFKPRTRLASLPTICPSALLRSYAHVSRFSSPEASLSQQYEKFLLRQSRKFLFKTGTLAG